MASYTWVKTDTGKEKQGENENQGENEQQNTSEKAKREAKQSEKSNQSDMKGKHREKEKHENFKEKRQDKIRRVEHQSDKARVARNMRPRTTCQARARRQDQNIFRDIHYYRATITSPEMPGGP